MNPGQLRCVFQGILVLVIQSVAARDSLALASPCAVSTDPTFRNPTIKANTFIRKGLGEFEAPRGQSKHKGVDILVRSNFPSKAAYAVFALAAGTVAYAQLNGGLAAGYGNVVVVDHGQDCYTLYAHLASEPFSSPEGNLDVRVGDAVAAGQLIGYFVKTDTDIGSSGNAVELDHVLRSQVHIEVFQAKSGRRGPGALKDTILPGAVLLNPTDLLLGLGYKIEKTAGEP